MDMKHRRPGGGGYIYLILGLDIKLDLLAGQGSDSSVPNISLAVWLRVG